MILDTIVAHKKTELERLKASTLLSDLEKEIGNVSGPRPFAGALKVRTSVQVISEMKKASPSGGLLARRFVPAEIASEYEQHGASALSVLTDHEFFQGSLKHLREARGSTALPALRKDFIIDPYQVFEARAWAADCILLIVRILSREDLATLQELARQLGMDALVETHTEEEVRIAADLGAELIGINNRDLDTLTVNLATTGRLRQFVPEGVTLISESGVKTPDDMRKLRDWGVDAALIGEALMRSPDRGKKLEALVKA